MAGVKSSYYGRARKAAYELWRGSDYMCTQDDEHPWSGFCVLRLAMRRVIDKQHEIESRAAYASLADETEQKAVLRAVYWDHLTVVGKSRYDTSPIKVPARFVQIPVSLVHQWIHAFDDLQTSIHAFPQVDNVSTICSLKVETDYIACAFEKVWQTVEGEEELNRIWQKIWQQMGQTLQTAPIVAAPEESFPHVDGDPTAYDFQMYEPTLTLP